MRLMGRRAHSPTATTKRMERPPLSPDREALNRLHDSLRSHRGPPHGWPRAPNSRMAHDLKGDPCEEVTYDPFVSRSPTADPRYGPAQGGVLAPDRASVPGQRFLHHAVVANPPQHRLPPTQTPW